MVTVDWITIGHRPTFFWCSQSIDLKSIHSFPWSSIDAPRCEQLRLVEFAFSRDTQSMMISLHFSIPYHIFIRSRSHYITKCLCICCDSSIFFINFRHIIGDTRYQAVWSMMTATSGCSMTTAFSMTWTLVAHIDQMIDRMRPFVEASRAQTRILR